MQITDLKKLKLPESPGVYFFVHRNSKAKKEILYIGKATSLKDRVKSYFSNDVIKTRGSRIIDMVTKSTTVEFQKTDSVLEALILESSLIKKFEPKYNIKEKDNKSYNHIIITDEKIPRVLIVRGKDLRDSDTLPKIKNQFGPFPNSSQLKEALKIIRKIFPFFDANKPIENFKKSDQKRYRLNYQIGLYPNIETKEDLKGYKKNIKNLKLFFEGKKNKIVTDLQKEMKEASKKLEFERAAKINKTIFAINHINDVSLLTAEENKNPDAITNTYRIESYDIAHLAGSNSVAVMTVMENGKLKKSDYRKFILKQTKKGDDYGGLEEVLKRRLNHPEWTYPDLIVVDGGKAQKKIAEKILKNEKIPVIIPVISVVKDEKHRPREILGQAELIKNKEKDILLINNETHRFAITFHRLKRNRMLK